MLACSFFSRATVAALGAAALLATSARASADDAGVAPMTNPAPPAARVALDPLAVPPGYHVETRPYYGPIIGGGSAFAFGYFMVAVLAAQNRHDGIAFVPFVGPFVAASQHRSTGFMDLSPGFYASFGVLEVVGGVIATAGLIARKRVVVPDDVHIAPIVARSTGGLAVSGSF
ncbi:MAG TPA: hypothetical protein VHB21_11630 [Minicystis sp.]|nr:hypothetical protein [Minicystis sp.]